MQAARVLRHLFATRWGTRRRFTPEVLARIEEALKRVEAQHAGELRFAIEAAFDLPELWYEVTPRQRALQVFGLLGVWDTEANNGVLIYMLMADHDVEIVADRAIAARVTQPSWMPCAATWSRISGRGVSPRALSPGSPLSGGCLGNTPGRGGDRDEQPNQPVLL